MSLRNNLLAKNAYLDPIKQRMSEESAKVPKLYRITIVYENSEEKIFESNRPAEFIEPHQCIYLKSGEVVKIHMNEINRTSTEIIKVTN